MLNTEKRISIVEGIHAIAEEFAVASEHKVYYSGLPYIRTEVSKKIKGELSLFIILAALVVVVIL